jgi:MFS family permease
MPERKRGGFSFSSIKTFSSLKEASYRYYFLGMLGQFASMNMRQASASLLLYRLTGSSALLGTMSLANAIPMLLLSLFGGVIADRVQKKGILSVSLLLSALINIAVGLALTTGLLSREHAGSWWILIASSLVQGIIVGLMMPSRQSIIPEIVSRGQLMNAVALNTLGMNVFRLLAPAAAGFLIDAFNFDAVYYAMAGANLYAAFMVTFIPATKPTAVAGESIIADIQDGFRYIRREKTVFLILLFTLFVVILAQPYQQLLPIYVDDILKVGAKGMGMLLSVSGAGAMVSSLVLASITIKKGGALLLLSGIISGLALISFSFSSSWHLSLAFIVFVGLGQTARGTISNALLQTYVDGAYIGRVMSVLMMQWGLVSLTTFIAGVLAEIIPVQWVLGGFAIALVIISAVALVAAPKVRNLA